MLNKNSDASEISVQVTLCLAERLRCQGQIATSALDRIHLAKAGGLEFMSFFEATLATGVGL